MKVRTLLNKMEVKNKQYIKVLDKKIGYCIQSFDKQMILEGCSKSKVVDFQYLKDEDCYLININKRKEGK